MASAAACCCAGIRCEYRSIVVIDSCPRRIFTEWLGQLNDWRKSGRRDEEALALLVEIIAATERVDDIDPDSTPPADDTKRAAILFKKLGDNAGEVVICDRYLARAHNADIAKSRAAAAARLAG